MRNKIKNAFLSQKITLNDGQIDKLLAYYDFLIQENAKYNLTAIEDFDEVVTKHFLDSALFALELKQNARVIDVGSGAGFPGIVVKILRPDIDIILLDSLQKRVNFLENVIKRLNLSKICAIHARAEDYAAREREKFDYALSRAVAKVNTLAEYLLPLVKVGGFAIMGKATKFEEELSEGKKAIEILGGMHKKTQNYVINDLKNANLCYERNIIYVQKVELTPAKYPRSGNKPRLNPL